MLVILVARLSIAIETEFSPVIVGVIDTAPEARTSFRPLASEGDPDS